jgi:3',5'-cyclic AMP phosphodiesterase CpdA
MSICIAQVSDFHVGSVYFIPEMAETVVAEVNAMEPDIVVITGDLTDMGYALEYEHAAEIVAGFTCPNVMVIPGNHDSRNVGEMHFERLWGPRNSEKQLPGLTIIGMDSAEPDLDYGKIGRLRYRQMQERFAEVPDDFKVVALHHHLVPVPGTGRERNTLLDAGDVLRVLGTSGVDVVLCGHKHVPNVWRLDDLIIVNTGTACSLKLRGNTKPSYSVVEVGDDHHVKVTQRTPGAGGDVVADYRKVHRTSCVWRPAFENDEGEEEW